MSQQLPEAAAQLLKTPLTPEQRLELIGELWDQLDVDEIPLLDWQREELERRLANAEANPKAAIPWEDVKRRLRDHGRRDPKLWRQRIN